MKYAFAGLLLCFITSALSASVLYRYKDENDRIVLGITVPPQFVKKGYEILNSKGRVIEVVPRAPTPEEIAERKRQEKLQAEKEKKEAEQKAADEALLKIYSHPDDAVRTLTRKLQDMQAVIKLKTGSISTDQNKLSDAQTRAANKERAGEKVPEKLLQEIEKYHQDISKSQTEIEDIKKEMHSAYGEFSEIIERLRFLTGKETKTDVPDELKLMMGLDPSKEEAQQETSTAQPGEKTQSAQIEGTWKIIQMGSMKENGEDRWEFHNGRFTQNLEGHRMASDAYSVNGNNLDLGYASITIIELNNDTMKAKYGPAIYTLQKISNTVDMTPKPRKELSKEAKEMAQEFAQALISNVSENGELNCTKSVTNSRQSLDTMIGVGEKNYRDGYLSKDEYERTSMKLKSIMKELTLEDCNGSTGNQKLFYTCMSNDRNMFISCAQKYMK